MARQIKFVNDGYYHVYNRGSRKADVFFEDRDYHRLEMLLDWCLKYSYPYSMYKHRADYYKRLGKDVDLLLQDIESFHRINTPQVEIVAYVWMPNHYHLVLKQVTDNGISAFMHRVATAYAKYINTKYGMSGSLFQGGMQAVQIKSDEQFIHTVRYVHINPLSASLVMEEDLVDYIWSSLYSYINGKENSFLTKKYVLDYFGGDIQRLYDFTVAQLEQGDVDLLEKVSIDDDCGWFEEKRKARKVGVGEILKKSV